MAPTRSIRVWTSRVLWAAGCPSGRRRRAGAGAPGVDGHSGRIGLGSSAPGGRRVIVRDGAAAIVECRHATGDASGNVDLMLALVEAEMEQAADLGYGDEAYLDALQFQLDAVAKEFDTLPTKYART